MGLPRAQTLLKRLFSCSSPSRNALQHLKERALIQIKGPDSSEFLQGLITNDIHHLSDGVGSMFAMFLNTKGRILYDTIVYKTEEKDAYLIECDSEATSALQKHLKVYKIRRKVEILQTDHFKVHALYNDSFSQREIGKIEILNGNYDTNKFPQSSTDLKTLKDVLIFKDPRVAHLGFRIISKDKEEDLKKILNTLVACEYSNSYTKLRYSLGIGEGTKDLPVENSFPLECNCDYLHGVSFHKGCYIGQELTARTYHTGVIRKRLMPLLFSKIPTSLPDNNIIIHNGKNLGKFRGIVDNVGLALLRVNQALESGTITIGNGEASVVKPDWWPIELPKEKVKHKTVS